MTSRRRPFRVRDARGDAAVSAVTDRLRARLGIAGTDVAPDDPLMESGLDSVAGVELQQRAEQEFGVKLEPTAALDHPTPAALGRHVADVMGLTRERDVGFGVYAAGLAASSAPAGGYGAAVTITAPVATYASGVNETFDFWRELASPRADPQTETPLSRYDADLHYHPTTVGEIGVVTVRHAAYLHADAHERFDADRLRVSAARRSTSTRSSVFSSSRARARRRTRRRRRSIAIARARTSGACTTRRRISNASTASTPARTQARVPARRSCAGGYRTAWVYPVRAFRRTRRVLRRSSPRTSRDAPWARATPTRGSPPG